MPLACVLYRVTFAAGWESPGSQVLGRLVLLVNSALDIWGAASISDLSVGNLDDLALDPQDIAGTSGLRPANLTSCPHDPPRSAPRRPEDAW